MYTTPEYVTLVQREREERIKESRLARVATCIRAVSNPTRFDRAARIFRLTPATC
jgi:hypothetical protein